MSKGLKFFLVVFIILAPLFFVSSRVVAFENSFNYVSDISYEPIAKLVNFLNDKKNELERYGDRLGKPNTVRHSVSNMSNTNNANARKSFLLSAVLETAKDAIVSKPKKYFGKVFCVAKDFVFPGACQNEVETDQNYAGATTQTKKNNEEEISALKQQYDDAITEANILNQKFNQLQQELGKVKAGGVVIKEPIIEQKTVERTIEKIVSGLSQDDLSAGIASVRTELNNLNTNLINQINNLSSNTSRQTTAVYQAVSLTNKIDSLTGINLTRITVNGVSGLTDSDIPDGITASNYLLLTGGTISGDLTINGNATLGVITLQNATAGYFTATSTAQASTFPYASTTALTVSGSAYIGSLNGPLQANNGLVSATTSIGYQYGGTGLTTTPSFGQILRGTGSGYSLVATSTLGINTSDLTEGSNLFWTNDRFDNRLSATTSLPNLITLANLSITGSQVSNLNTLWDNRLSATTTLPNITTLANLATVGTITSGTWNGSTIAVNKGGTGQTSFGQGWLNSDGTTLSASTSPTVNYITATSTTATSTFPLLKTATAFQLGTDYLTDITGTGLQITNNALTLNATGDWTGTFDGQEGTYYLARGNHTGTQGISTLSNYDWTFSSNYGVNNITGSTTMPVWASGGLNASSTSNFVYASTTALTVSGNSYLGTVSSGLWNATSLSDAFVDDNITLTNLTQITNRAISDTTGTLTVGRGGTGQTSFSQGWLNSDGTSLSASTSPTVNYITATSTTATSTISGNLHIVNNLRVDGNFFAPVQLVSSGNATINGTLTVAGQTTLATSLTGLIKAASGVISAITTSAGIAGEVSDETGSGALVFGTSPTFTTQITTPIIIVNSTTATSTFATGGLTVGTNQFVVQQTSGKVGIGTTTPGSKLSVSGGTSIGTNYGVAAPTNGLIVEGNVGIGTAAPSQKLEVNGNLRITGGGNGGGNVPSDAFLIGSGAKAITFLSDSAGVSVDGYIGAWNTVYNDQNSKIVFDKPAGNVGQILFYTQGGAGGAGLERMRITDQGSVGIGTTSPWRTLSATGTVGFDGLTGATGAGSLCLDSNKQVVYNSASDACLSSTRATKHDIQNLNLDGLSLINQLQPSSFIYNQGDGRLRYGFMAEDTALVDDRLATHNEKGEITGIDDRAIMSVAVKAIQDLNLKVSDLQASVAGSGGQTTDSLFSWILGKFSAIGIMFGQDKLGAKKGVFESFEMKDASTGEEYCVKIRNGEWEKIKGTCGETSLSSSSISSETSSSSVATSSSSSSETVSSSSTESSSSESSSESSSSSSSSESNSATSEVLPSSQSSSSSTTEVSSSSSSSEAVSSSSATSSSSVFSETSSSSSSVVN